MKKVLIISTSPRKDGNSDMLAQEFMRGAKEAGNEVEYVSLIGKNISFCKGCFACQVTKQCVIKDDANAICEQILHADVVVWATPVYYYSVSGQMKTMIDRANSLYTTDYKFRDIYLLASAAEDEAHTVEGAVKVAQGWADCFEKAQFKGYVFAGGVTMKGDIKNHKALAEAYEMGKKV
ncbi:MAG: flavodoxin family protein [Prevotella sp.]|jgi:multimeric flavodoxin WrbA|nr:flavodoxin family protein [Prevotella sp.]